MIFTEARFLAFFLLVLAVHWTLRGERTRKLWLLLTSYVFYAGWDWRFLSLLWLSTLVDWWVAWHLGTVEERWRRRAWIATSVSVNLAVLGFFKYWNFFVESAVALSHAVGLPASAPTLAVILPVGISFYTFQTMSYTLDVYRRRLEPVKSLLDVALFVAFFPQLVAGPIVRAADFLPQLRGARRFAAVEVRASLWLFLVGFVKKACIGDNLAHSVDRYFADPAGHDALSAWTAALGYAVQIYCDFSGYSDMAIATAALLGYRLMRNFDFPYMARSVREFWRRWHISLSTWLRDYLYIALGGNRGSRSRVHANLLLTMLLGGLWHGAAWTFVVWGGLHGLALVAGREWSARVRPGSPPARLLALLSWPLTFVWVLLTWIFFRAESLGDALAASRSFLLLGGGGPARIETGVLVVVALFLAAHALGERRLVERSLERLDPFGFAAVYGAAAAVALNFLHVGVKPFIYFQF